jgi:hypothetical protein
MIRLRPVSCRWTGVGVMLAILCGLLPAWARAASRWTPPQQLTWYWQLTGTPQVEPVAATDIDGFDNSSATVADFHAIGQRMICYIDVGTWENWRPDASQFPDTVLGSGNGWPGERWLDVRQLAVLEPIMAARFEMCQQKGFDAVEPDNMDGYENNTGFPITAAEQLAYDMWIAQVVHSLGMAVFQKNDPDQAAQLEPYFDGVIDEQCNQYSECSSYQPYLSAGKPVLNAEYGASLYPSFCAADQAAGMMGALYATALDGSVYHPCFGPTLSLPPISSSSGTGSASPGGRNSGPRVSIRSVAAMTKHGAVALKLTCTSGQSFCDGTVELAAVAAALRATSRHSRITVVFGETPFRIPGGRTKLILVKLRRKALKRLSARRLIDAVVTVTATDAGGGVVVARHRVQLRP